MGSGKRSVTPAFTLAAQQRKRCRRCAVPPHSRILAARAPYKRVPRPAADRLEPRAWIVHPACSGHLRQPETSKLDELPFFDGNLPPRLRQVFHGQDALVSAERFGQPASPLAAHCVFQWEQELVNVAFDEKNVVWIRHLLNQAGEVITQRKLFLLPIEIGDVIDR